MNNPTKQSVDALVQAAIENLRAGRSVEDDAGIEFKRVWPDPPSKNARQLAGAANALRGDVLIYVIGVDDKTGEITTPEKREAKEWYEQIRKPFDQVVPELLWSQTVFVGDGSSSVQALVFDTSSFPYVINIENARREVPFRQGGGTISAHRSQLVRMFDPAVVVPRMEITAAKVWADWTELQSYEDQPYLSLRAEVHVYVEHLGTRPVTLPIRRMRARLRCERFVCRFDVHVRHVGQGPNEFWPRPHDPTTPAPVPPEFGVYALNQHVMATAPGEFEVRNRIYLPAEGEKDGKNVADWKTAINETPTVTIELAIPVAGSDVTVKLAKGLVEHRFSNEEFESYADQFGYPLTMWELPNSSDDPWHQVDDDESVADDAG